MLELNRDADFRIAKNTIDTVFTKNEPLDYKKWVDFIDVHQEQFIWREKTKDGIDALNNIDNVPESFRERVMNSLKKGSCYKEFDEEKGYYNINVGFNNINHWISIGFERTPVITDLKIFLEMANHLDALLLKDGTEIINEKVLKNLM
jgi:hypothetical protein